jgi:DNA polymerase delta subunit 2
MTIQHSIPAPPPPKKFFSEEDSVMLEDESGRIRLVGKQVTKARLVTGVIVAVLGVETPNGEFEVVDLCAAGLAPQTRSKEEKEKRFEKMDVDGESLRCFHLSL